MITLTSDFGVQTQDVAMMEAAIYEINPDEKVIHLAHYITDFDTISAAWIMESVIKIKPAIHVCVVDPGVGTSRKGLIIETKRGDYLVGPDNGVLIPAARTLGFVKAVELKNEKYMRQPVCPVFHGRDVFAPAGAYLSKGVPMEDFGPVVEPKTLQKAVYNYAVLHHKKIRARVIKISKFGSINLNVRPAELHKICIQGHKLIVRFNKEVLLIPYASTFGDVPIGSPVLFNDDYNTIQIALNQGAFADKFGIKIGDEVMLSLD